MPLWGIPWMEILERTRPAVPSAVARGYGGTKSHSPRCVATGGEAGAIQREKNEEREKVPDTFNHPKNC